MRCPDPLLAGLTVLFTAGTLLGWRQASAQTITLQVLDGHSGKPISSSTVQVDCLAGPNGCPGISAYAPPPETRLGELKLHPPANATTLTVMSSEDQYTFCAGWKLGDGDFSMQSIRTIGLLATNHCGHPRRKALQPWQPQPGRLVVFAVRKPWWRRLLPYC